MSLKLIKILIIFLYLKNPTIFGENPENITSAPLHGSPFNYTPDPRAVGGYRSEGHALAKYVVSIRKTRENPIQFGFTHFCTGSIIGPNRILTAAHCFFKGKKKAKPSEIKVMARNYMRYNKTKETEEISVKEIIYHPNYPGLGHFNDIALLILMKDIQLDGVLAAKISLPQHDIETDKLCTVVGWGKMYENGPMANNLQYGDLHVRSIGHCRKWFPTSSRNKICPLIKHDKEINTCNSDSGGPLICSNGKDVLTGIVSYGYNCASGYPRVYIDVYRYLDWINADKGSHLKPLPIMLCFIVIVCLCRLQYL